MSTKHILLVENNVPDALVVQRALRNLKGLNGVSTVEDGDQVYPYLRAEGSYAGRVTPSLILLDLNMTRMNGYEVLDQLKQDPQYRHIPVLVLSGSEAPRDVHYCYAHGCSAYLIKPGSPEAARVLFESVERVWHTMGRLP